MEFATLYNGVKMPRVGYGVYRIPAEQCEACVRDALEVGYRSIDTAQAYFNEGAVGQAVKASGIGRENIFITSKVRITNYGETLTRKSIEDSLWTLQTDYIDLMLLHQPFGDIYGSWKALEDLYEEGKLRAIGISNFYADRMTEFAIYNRIRPMVNQVEAHPLFGQKEVVEWAGKYEILPEAWAPFGAGTRGLFENRTLIEIAEKYGKTVAQIMLRWNLQRGVSVIPKSTHKERMAENLAVFDFELEAEDMMRIDGLETGESSFFSHRDPAAVERFVQKVKANTEAQKRKDA